MDEQRHEGDVQMIFDATRFVLPGYVPDDAEWIAVAGEFAEGAKK